MLRSLAEGKLSANFLIIEDKDVCCEDLFVAFLFDFQLNNPKTKTKINLICYENPPEFYLSGVKLTDKSIISYNYFSDPVGWKNPSNPKTDLSVFTSSNSQDLSESVFFIDSISLLVHYHGFCVAYKNLSFLKTVCKRIVCLSHGDVLGPEELEELYFLATAVIRVGDVPGKQNSDERTAEVILKKPGGKVVKEEQVFNVSDDFKISCKIKEAKNLVLQKEKTDMENLTTFKLGIHMSEEEKKAKQNLVLPYLRSQKKTDMGEIIYQPETDELEDDPDDDLDI